MSDDDRSEPSNLIEVDFSARPTRPPVEPRASLLPTPPAQRKPRCSHEAVFVDDRSREVTCQDCSAAVDPVTFLMLLANREQRLLWSRQEVHALAERIEALRTEEKRVKARVRRGQEKAYGAQLGDLTGTLRVAALEELARRDRQSS